MRTMLKGLLTLALLVTALTPPVHADAGGAPYVMERHYYIDRYGCMHMTTYWSNADYSDVVTSCSGYK